MTRYRVNANFEMVGAFWPYAKPEDVVTGVLSSQNGKVSLLTSPTYSSVLGADTLSEAVRQMNGAQGPRRTPSLCGFSTDSVCTLLDPIIMDGGGLTDFSSGQRVTANRFEMARTVMGLQLESCEADSIDGAGFFLSKIHFLLPTPWDITWEQETQTYVSPTRAHEVFRFCSTALRAEIICEVFSSGSGKVKKGIKIKSVPRIRIVPEARQSLDWFVTLAFRLENFFTLLLGTSVHLKSVQLFQAEKMGWLVQRTKRRTEKKNYEAIVRCNSHTMADALARWLAVPVEQRPVEKTLFGMLRKSSLFAETEFLSLAQALEGFGRIKIRKYVLYATPR